MTNITADDTSDTNLRLAMSALEDSWDSTDWSRETGKRIYDVFVAALKATSSSMNHKSLYVERSVKMGNAIMKGVTIDLSNLVARDNTILSCTSDAYQALVSELEFLGTAYNWDVFVDEGRKVLIKSR